MFKLTIKPVYAHCDLPCGIYETDTMKHAAATCMRMIEKIEQLGDLDTPDKLNGFSRAVAIKERHAQKVKDEAYILWSDYFKSEHLEKFPQIHDVFWAVAKQASTVKQSVSKDACDSLLQKVADADALFTESKS